MRTSLGPPPPRFNVVGELEPKKNLIALDLPINIERGGGRGGSPCSGPQPRLSKNHFENLVRLPKESTFFCTCFSKEVRAYFCMFAVLSHVH